MDVKKEKAGRKHIDWDEVRRRIESASSDHEVLPRTEEHKKKVLKERARKLAVEPEAKADGAQKAFEAVEFVLAHERYAVASEDVREIFPIHELTPVPCTPPFVLGIINVRGQILSVIDIKKFFDLPAKGLTDLNKVIILRSGEMEFGILADAIAGVRNISMGELESALPTMNDLRAEYLTGITKDRVAVLDAKRLLSDRRILVHENIET
ncbi:MAG: chemotaxis protein CheW [Deltaproteobacteria bacterium]|nr:chemotaxis protein CheW [Deltaproteobacteria bacterium]